MLLSTFLFRIPSQSIKVQLIKLSRKNSTRNTYGFSRTFHCNICTHSLYLFGLIGMPIRTRQNDTKTGKIRAIFHDNLSNQDARSYILGFSPGDCSSYMIRAMVDCDVLRADNICFTSIAACLESCKGAERRPTIYSWLVYDILVLHFKRQPLSAGW